MGNRVQPKIEEEEEEEEKDDEVDFMADYACSVFADIETEMSISFRNVGSVMAEAAGRTQVINDALFKQLFFEEDVELKVFRNALARSGASTALFENFTFLPCILYSKVLIPVHFVKEVYTKELHRLPVSYKEIVAALRMPERLFAPMSTLWKSSDGLFMDEAVHTAVVRAVSPFFSAIVERLVRMAPQRHFRMSYFQDLRHWFARGNPFAYVNDMQEPLQEYFVTVVPLLNDLQRTQPSHNLKLVPDLDFAEVVRADGSAQERIIHLMHRSFAEYMAWMQGLTYAARLAAFLYVGAFVAPEALFPQPFHTQTAGYRQALTIIFENMPQCLQCVQELQNAAKVLLQALQRIRDSSYLRTMDYPIQCAMTSARTLFTGTVMTEEL